MSHKIEAYAGTLPTTPTRSVGRVRDTGSPVDQTPRTPPRDALALTGDARLLQQVTQHARADSGVDASRVAEIRTALAEGSYQTDPQAIAQRLMQFEGGLGD